MVVLRIKDGSGVVSEHRLPMSWREVDRSLLCELLELRAMGKGEKWWLDAAFLLLPVAVQDLLCEADVMSFASFLGWIWDEEVLLFEALNGIVVSGVALYLPNRGMYNVCGNEWIDGNGYLIMHAKGVAGMVDRVIAVYCRSERAGYDVDLHDDRRISYTVESANRRAEWIRDNMSDIVKAVLFAYLVQETQRVVDSPRYGKLFPNWDGEGVRPLPSVDVWYNFMLDAARLPNLGRDYDVTVQKPLHLILGAVLNEIKIQEG